MRKLRYGHINVLSSITHNGNEYLYFSVYDGLVVQWQRGADTLNVKTHAELNSPDLECFSLSYASAKPTMRDAKAAIVDYCNGK